MTIGSLMPRQVTYFPAASAPFLLALGGVERCVAAFSEGCTGVYSQRPCWSGQQVNDCWNAGRLVPDTPPARRLYLARGKSVALRDARSPWLCEHCEMEPWKATL